MFEFGALGLVSIISPSFKLETMHRFFCWIPYSFKNPLTKFENFLSTGSTNWKSTQSVRWISIKVNYWSRFEFGAPELGLVISPSYEIGIALHIFLLVSLFFMEHYIKISKFSHLARSVGIRFIKSTYMEH